jgi:hypothetical protein
MVSLVVIYLEVIMKLTFYDVLTIAFIVLKLCGVIDWNWLWVVSPTLIERILISIINIIGW